MEFDIAAATSIGLEPTRTTNQDAYAHGSGRIVSEATSSSFALVAVADGMGGMSGGELASQAAVQSVLNQASALSTRPEALCAADQANEVARWLKNANDEVFQILSERDVRGGCTLVCGCVVDRRLAIAHVGDSRAYLLRGETLTPLTRDHSLVMGLVLQGEIDISELRTHPDRSSVTRSLGERKSLPDFYIDTLSQTRNAPTLEIEDGDLLLLCTDGVWEPVLEQDFVEVAGRAAREPHAMACELVRLSLARGGHDNATIVVLRARDVVI
jgi:protein phosphatase